MIILSVRRAAAYSFVLLTYCVCCDINFGWSPILDKKFAEFDSHLRDKQVVVAGRVVGSSALNRLVLLFYEVVKW